MVQPGEMGGAGAGEVWKSRPEGVGGLCTPNCYLGDLGSGDRAPQSGTCRVGSMPVCYVGGGLEWGDDDPPQSVTCRDSGFRVCAPQSGTSGDQLTPVRGCGDGAPQCLAGGCRGWSP